MDAERNQLERARQGDADAFAELVERYSSRIYGACFGFLGNRQDAEDCVQDTFIKAWRALGDYNFLASFYTWLYRIAVNTCLDYRRRNQRVHVYSLDEALDTEDSQVFLQVADEAPLPDELAESAELRRLIREEIDRLPPQMRSILVLRDLQDVTYHDLAQILEISEGTVKSRLSRARQMLMKRVARRETQALEQSTARRRLKDKHE
jgi:RNA polymerase sigma-70 factor (ECF subfamily)